MALAKPASADQRNLVVVDETTLIDAGFDSVDQLRITQTAIAEVSLHFNDISFIDKKLSGGTFAYTVDPEEFKGENVAAPFAAISDFIT